MAGNMDDLLGKLDENAARHSIDVGPAPPPDSPKATEPEQDTSGTDKVENGDSDKATSSSETTATAVSPTNRDTGSADTHGETALRVPIPTVSPKNFLRRIC